MTEPRPPKLAIWLLLRFLRADERGDVLGDLEDDFHDRVNESGAGKAAHSYWKEVITALPAFLIRSIIWSLVMFRSHLILALRTLRKRKGFAFINISGLAVGLAFSAIIVLYVINELTYDGYHRDSENIYRVISHRIGELGEDFASSSSAPLGPAMMRDLSQVEVASRIVAPFENSEHVLVEHDHFRFFENRVFFVDPEIFDIFEIPFLRGNPALALDRSNTVVISEQMARKYFGDENPVGQTLRIELDYDRPPVELQEFEVTGVVVNARSNTHFKYDMLVSIETLRANATEFEENWGIWPPKFNYVRLFPGAAPGTVEEGIQGLGQLANENNYYELFEFQLQPVTDIHMSGLTFLDLEPGGNWYYIYIYSFVAVLILLIGCMSFMNLSTAMSSTRSREVGLRKVVGAFRSQLVKQFLGESFIVTILAFLAAFFLVLLLLPLFNDLAGTALTVADMNHPRVLLSIAGLLVLVGLGSGVYPALILTAFRPVSVLKGSGDPSARGAWMQKTLVVGQFAISVLLVVCTLTAREQLNFMKGQSLGFEREQKLVLRANSNLSFLRTNYELVKDAFTVHPSIIGATVSSGVPGRQNGGYYMRIEGIPDPEPLRMKVFAVDYDFIDELGLEIIAGRGFQPELGIDEADSYIINEASVRLLGLSSAEEALGMRLNSHYHGLTKTVVGVMSDFHYQGMQRTVDPMALDIETSLFDHITLAVSPANMNETMAFVEEKWAELFPGVPIESTFLDEIFDQEYRYEEQVSRLLNIISVLGLGIACMGLFGMGAFLARRRQKEIGIRKALGATVPNIVSMLSRQFVVLVIGGALVATPLAWIATNRWLDDFAYHVDVGAAVFVIAGIAALVVSLASVSYQGMRAARLSPIESLRDE